MFGKIHGRFFLQQYLGITSDDTPYTFTLSDLIETYPLWESFVINARKEVKHVKLFTMFETNDVHPEIIEKMKLFDEVIVPYDYLKDILLKHGVKCKALNYWTSSLIRSKPKVIHKIRDPSKLIFLYNGTNDIRKNVTTLTRVFAKVLENTEHMLVVKTNKPDNLTITKNIRVITEHISDEQLASLFNLCDYCVTCTRGEGVGLLHLEAKYFNKPIISHDQGVFKQLGVDIIPLPSKEVDIDYTYVPDYLKKVFYGKWWEIDENAMIKIITNLCLPKINIYYRISDKGRRSGKPDFINSENCLRNFCEHFNLSNITIIADNCEDTTIDMIKKYIDENNITRTSLGNSGAFLYAAKKAIKENCDDTIVYLVEDDYLHVKNSENVIKEGFKYGDYISLYDHPDKYIDDGGPNPYVFGGGEETKVFLTKSTHWKYTNSTTMTFAVRNKILKDDIEIMEKYCKDKIPDDFQMFCELLNYKKRKLVTPIPGMSTHGQLPWFTPLVDWKSKK